MKHIVLSAASVAILSLAAAGANAQILKSYGGMVAIPGSVTTDGKAMFATAEYLGESNTQGSRYVSNESDYDDDNDDRFHISIYNTRLQKQTEFDFQLPRLEYSYHTERAVTDTKITDLVCEVYHNDYIMSYVGEEEFTSFEQFVTYISSYLGFTPYVFVASDGQLAVTRNEEYLFYDYWRFGKLFPRVYYRYYKDEYGWTFIKEFTVEYEMDWEKMDSIYANFENYSWQKVGESHIGHFNTRFAHYHLYNLDRSASGASLEMEDVPFSQNVFNSDDNWEYAVVRETYHEDLVGELETDENGYICLSRTANENPADTDFDLMIVSHDGTVLNKIKFGYDLCNGSEDAFEVYIMDGKTYLLMALHDDEGEHYSALYEYSAFTSDLNLVQMTRQKVAASVVSRGESVKLDLGNGTSNLKVTNMAGQTLMQHKASGETSIETGSLASGVYNITVSNDCKGMAPKTQRFVVK